MNERGLDTGHGVSKSEENLQLAMPANPKVLNGGVDSGVGVTVAVWHTLPPMRVFSVFEIRKARLAQDDGAVVAGTAWTLFPYDRTPCSMTALHGLTRSAHHGHDPEKYSGSTRWRLVDCLWMDS